MSRASLKILLLGEYSNVHATLSDGLRQLGHKVTVMSNGDFWKDLLNSRPNESCPYIVFCEGTIDVWCWVPWEWIIIGCMSAVCASSYAIVIST